MKKKQTVRSPVKSTLAERFQRYHREHPQVYRELEECALDLKRRAPPGETCSIAMITEVGRVTRSWVRGSRVRFDNAFRAFYARLLIEHHPELAGFLTTRSQRTSTFERTLAAPGAPGTPDEAGEVDTPEKAGV